MSTQVNSPIPVSGPSLAEQAYLFIRDRLVMLDIKPGDPINEDWLGSTLGMGRTPVREALKRLETEHLVVAYPRRGTFATDVNISDLAHISEVRRTLEPMATAAAAERASDADRAGLTMRLARAARHGEPGRQHRTAAHRPRTAPRDLRLRAQPVPRGHPDPLRQPRHPHLVCVPAAPARHGRPRERAPAAAHGDHRGRREEGRRPHTRPRDRVRTGDPRAD